MKGTVLDFSIQSNQGVVSGDDGSRYTFKGAEWKAQNIPSRGQTVDFLLADGAVVDIYLLASAAKLSDKSKIVAGLLALFLGYLGIHKFYLGYKGAGLTVLGIFLFCSFFIFVQPAFFILLVPVLSLISFIEFIIYVCKSDAEFENAYVQGRRPWF